MTMEFRTVKTAIEGILNAGAVAGSYRVAGYQDQSQSAIQVKDSLRVVRVYYNSGEFPKSAGSRLANVTHELTFPIELTVSKASKGDLSALEAATTDSARLIAMNTFTDSKKLVDDAIDEFIDIIYNVLMTAAQRDLGLSVGQVSNTWISRAEKSDVTAYGNLVSITANMELNCKVTEFLDGDIGVSADPVLKAVLDDIEVYMFGDQQTADAGLAALRGGN